MRFNQFYGSMPETAHLNVSKVDVTAHLPGVNTVTVRL